ncbi:MAG TPA: MoxR family ATPase [Candidatus Nanoarchaeia archaeon]|nr:MoxR family ATPase [Candidatus Nanoarchaeia archaeon]
MSHQKHSFKKSSSIDCITSMQAIRAELKKAVVGQDDVIDQIFIALLAKGNVLIEGVPGTAKSLLVRCIADAIGCTFSRVQFSVDLLPSDIVGLSTIAPNGKLDVIKGPVFANFVMADEVNRAPPKTQSALLEAMGEGQVSIGKKTFILQKPFFVLATENPLESSGTYPLPEAQLDRFLFKVVMYYPSKEEETRVIEQNISLRSLDSYGIRQVLSGKQIMELQEAAQQVKHNPRINKYIVDIVNATRTPKEYGIEKGKYLVVGASPRASIFLFMAGKANALIEGKTHLMPQHIKNVALPILRHRIKLDYRAKIDGVTTDDIVEEILRKVPIP